MVIAQQRKVTVLALGRVADRVIPVYSKSKMYSALQSILDLAPTLSFQGIKLIDTGTYNNWVYTYYERNE